MELVRPEFSETFDNSFGGSIVMEGSNVAAAVLAKQEEVRS
jgi:hypothetical protein